MGPRSRCDFFAGKLLSCLPTFGSLLVAAVKSYFFSPLDCSMLHVRGPSNPARWQETTDEQRWWFEMPSEATSHTGQRPLLRAIKALHMKAFLRI